MKSAVSSYTLVAVGQSTTVYLLMVYFTVPSVEYGMEDRCCRLKWGRSTIPDFVEIFIRTVGGQAEIKVEHLPNSNQNIIG
jgi:hypothetical protein